MVFKNPGKGQNNQSGRSSNKVSKVDTRTKRSSSSRGKFSSGPDNSEDNNQAKKNYDERSDKKRTHSSGRKPFNSKEGNEAKASNNFNGGEKQSHSAGNKPYTGRLGDNDDKPGRRTSNYRGSSGSSGEKKSFSPKNRPYSGRTADNDERPKRTTNSYRGNSQPLGEKKSFSPKLKPYSGRATDYSERPERGPNNYRSSSKRPVETKFAAKSSDKSGFKRREDYKSYSSDRPQRSKPHDIIISSDQDAPVKTLRGRKKGAESKDSGLIRLNRYISNAGICSRRKADELIVAGVVSVNGVVISELGHKVDPQKDEIRYNGETLKREKMVYVLLNKPKDYITTTEDPQERRTVMHLVEKASKERIYPIGRLDRNTTGLLLMTNDGDLADKLSHPKNNIVKLYQVELNKSLTQGDLNKIAFGLELEDGLIKPDSISYVAGGTKREIGIQIHSGKNRIVRRIFEHLGYEVVKLDRAVYANLTKKDLPRGRWRFLDESEVIQLKHLI